MSHSLTVFTSLLNVDFVAVYFRTKVRRRSSETRILLRINGVIDIFKSMVFVEWLQI